MNIEKIFSALAEDEMNSALGIICSELESQGYKIEIEGIEVTSGEVLITNSLHLKKFLKH